MKKEEVNRIAMEAPLELEPLQIREFLANATDEQKEEYTTKIGKKKRLKRCKEELRFWRRRPKFEDRADVPPLPRVNAKIWKYLIVPTLIEAGAIPMMELEDGAVYEGRHRVGKVARWDAEKKEFEYPYWEFNQKATMKCNHFEMDDGFALFVPLKKVAEKEVDLLTYLD